MDSETDADAAATADADGDPSADWRRSRRTLRRRCTWPIIPLLGLRRLNFFRGLCLGNALAVDLPLTLVAFERADALLAARQHLECRSTRLRGRQRHLGGAGEITERLFGLATPFPVDGSRVAADALQFRLQRSESAPAGLARAAVSSQG